MHVLLVIERICGLFHDWTWSSFIYFEICTRLHLCLLREFLLYSYIPSSPIWFDSIFKVQYTPVRIISKFRIFKRRLNLSVLNSFQNLDYNFPNKIIVSILAYQFAYLQSQINNCINVGSVNFRLFFNIQLKRAVLAANNK